MHYSIERPTDAGAAGILDATLESFATDREMQSDLSLLEQRMLPAAALRDPTGRPSPRIPGKITYHFCRAILRVALRNSERIF